MKRLIVGVAAALLLAPAPVAADGLPSRGSIKDTGVTIVGPSWNGFYVGVGIGAGAVVRDVSVSADGDGDKKDEFLVAMREHGYDGELLGLDGIGGEGIFGTVTIGYDRVIRPGWVLGVFADYDFASNISTDITLFGETGSIDQESTWAVGGRLGYLTSPGTLLYGTAGYTQTEFDYGDLYLGSQDFGGYFVGAGIETFLRPNWTLKLEYRFAQFDDETLFEDDGLNLSIEPSSHTARLVLSYRFGQHH